MKSLTPVVLALLFIIGCAASCKRDGSNSTTLDPASAKAVQAQMAIFEDSIRVNWDQVNSTANHKLETTRQLLIEAQGRVDNAKLSKFTGYTETLQRLHLEQHNLAESGRIDQYDVAQDSLFNPLIHTIAPNNQAPTEKIRDLVEAILQDDAVEVSQRIRYDRAVKKYNNYLQLHKDEFQRMGGRYAKLEPLPLFELAR